MYTEKIDNTLASALLGSDYREGLSYVLYSDRDKFTITGYDNEGNRSLEVELEKDDVGGSDDSSYEEEEESLTPAPRKRSTPIGSIIAIIMLLICAASIAAVVMFLSERR